MSAPKDQCPNCEKPGGTLVSTVDGTRRYRCSHCLWSWRKTVAPDEKEAT